MQIQHHQVGTNRIAEIVDTGYPVEAKFVVDELVNSIYEDCQGMIVHEATLQSGFFDLSSGIAGEMLQKFSTYGMRLAIVGDFTKYQSKSLADFIRESNRLGNIIFVPAMQQALDKFAE